MNPFHCLRGHSSGGGRESANPTSTSLRRDRIWRESSHQGPSFRHKDTPSASPQSARSHSEERGTERRKETREKISKGLRTQLRPSFLSFKIYLKSDNQKLAQPTSQYFSQNLVPSSICMLLRGPLVGVGDKGCCQGRRWGQGLVGTEGGL